MEEKVSVKFIKPWEGRVEGRMLKIRVDEILELPLGLAKDLFEKRVVLPGPQHGKLISITD